MINIVLLGTGNVATHLFRLFQKSENLRVKQVYNHSPESLIGFRESSRTTTSLEELEDADIYCLALKDDVIGDVSRKLPKSNALVVHTSGAASIDILKNQDRAGVFYPLQTFSKNRELAYPELPVCLEANFPEDLELLKRLSREISAKPYLINSPQRKRMHLAAVFVCNFVNHLYGIGNHICQENEIPFEVLLPLIKETAKKVENSSPFEVQTGPAIRNDRTTVKAHLDLLNNNQHKEIYQLLTKAIQNTHGKKL